MPDTFGPDDADPASPHTGEGEPPPKPPHALG